MNYEAILSFARECPEMFKQHVEWGCKGCLAFLEEYRTREGKDFA